MSRIWSAEHSNHEKAIIFFYSTLHLTYYSLFSPTSECAKYTFEWLFRHYYFISDFFVSQKHRKFRIVLRGNLIKHKPALHNSLISEEWCAAIVISKKDKPKYYYKLKADKFKLFAYTTSYYLCIFSKFKTFFHHIHASMHQQI